MYIYIGQEVINPVYKQSEILHNRKRLLIKHKKKEEEIKTNFQSILDECKKRNGECIK